jgi:predicted DNA repair protein MutK
MASGFFALLDDIAMLMDDVAVISKVAAKKTAGILGDDLAVNAEKASGFVASREIPVLWAITKGSFINKLIILPFAFLLSAFLPWVITPILLVGALYLAYEGAEKIYTFFVPHEHVKSQVEKEALTKAEILLKEKKKIKSAIVTDFILSIEIVIVALGSVVEEPLSTQIMAVSFVAVLATIGVYGIVALIVRMDDLGFSLINLSKRKNSVSEIIGTLLVQALPKVIKSLSVIGTLALLLVSGGIFVHNIEFIHQLFHGLPSLIAEFIVGLIVGFICLIILEALQKVYTSIKKAD